MRALGSTLFTRVRLGNQFNTCNNAEQSTVTNETTTTNIYGNQRHTNLVTADPLDNINSRG